MCFKKKGLVFMVLSSALVLLTGCDLFIGDKPVEDQEIAIGTRFSCMSQIGPTLKAYMDSELSAAQIQEFGDCIQYSLTAFEVYTRGESRHSYSPHEIRLFLQRYFLKDKAISDALLNHVMKAKQAILGGSDSALTRRELHRMVDIVGRLTDEAINLLPHMETLTGHINGQRREDPLSRNKMEVAIAELRTSMRAVSKIFTEAAAKYSLDSLEVLLHEFRKFADWDLHFRNTRSAKRWVNLGKAFKKIVTGTDKDVVYPEEWPMLFDQSIEVLALFVRVDYLLDQNTILMGKGLKDLNGLSSSIRTFLEEAIEQHEGGVITFEDIDFALMSMGELDLIPFGLHSNALKQPLRLLLGRVFGDLHLPPSERRATGLGRFQLGEIGAEVDRFIQAQLQINDLFQPNERYLLNDADLSGGHFEVLKKINPMQSLNDVPVAEVQEKTDILNEVLHLSEAIRPLFKNGGMRIVLAPEEQLAQLGVVEGFHNLTMINLFRMLSRVVLRGYAEDTSRFWQLTGVTMDEFNRFYHDFRSMGYDLKLTDPRSKDAGKRSYFEANLFTFASDGYQRPKKISEIYGPVLPSPSVQKEERQAIQQEVLLRKEHLLSHEELVEFFLYLLSGSQLAAEIYYAASDQCLYGPLDIFYRPMLERDCFNRNFRGYLNQTLTEMPYLRASVAAMNEAQWQRFSEELLSLVKNPDYSLDQWLERPELSTLAMILHYSETLMIRFDVNHDFVIDSDEAVDAFPIFEGYLKSLTNEMGLDLSEEKVESVFYFLLEHKDIPTEDLSTWFEMEWSSWMGWDIELDRLGMAEVFNKIAEGMLIGPEKKEGRNEDEVSLNLTPRQRLHTNKSKRRYKQDASPIRDSSHRQNRRNRFHRQRVVSKGN